MLEEAAFSEPETLIEVLQMLGLAGSCVDRALEADPATSPEDSESLLSVRAEIECAKALLKKQLS